jgi:hypothetical protein
VPSKINANLAAKKETAIIALSEDGRGQIEKGSLRIAEALEKLGGQERAWLGVRHV